MCGRYAFYMSPEKLKNALGCENILNLEPRYNCGPMQDLPVVVHNRMGMARWGFIPQWKSPDDTSFAAKMINARSETVSQKPTFQDSWHKGRRCLIPANGFFEWKKIEGEDKKQPYFITDPNEDCLFFAGLWSKTGTTVTFTILTKQADGPVADIHHRSPVLIRQESAGAWFGANQDEAASIISQSSSARLEAHKVGYEVGNIRNEGKNLIETIAA